MLARKPCPICGSKYRSIEIRHYKDNKVDKAWKVRKCSNCGYIISVKSISPEEAKKYSEEMFKSIEEIKAKIIKNIEEHIDYCKSLIKKLLE